MELSDMHEDIVRTRAFAMPLTSPAYPIGPYRFRNREYLIITYRTDPHKLRELVPEPLQVREPVVKFEFIRMPDSTGFGDYTESGQVIPVSFRGRKGSYSHCMFLNESLSLWSHALAPVAELPVLEVVSAMHLVADLTLALGRVVHDYLASPESLHRTGRSHEPAI
jgi:acetoacetate decarboxylase